MENLQQKLSLAPEPFKEKSVVDPPALTQLYTVAFQQLLFSLLLLHVANNHQMIQNLSLELPEFLFGNHYKVKVIQSLHCILRLL